MSERLCNTLHNSMEDVINKELETVFEFSYDPMYVIDGNGIVLRVNPACSRFYGFPQEQMLGKNIEELEDLNVLSPDAARRALRTGMRISMTEVFQFKREILVTATPVMNEENKIVRVVCNLRDMTELMTLKLKIEEAEKMKHEYETKLQEVIHVSGSSIVLRSSSIRSSFDMGLRVAKFDSTVLILGESGVGKNILARYIHENCSRAHGPYIEVNCGAISETLLESELFGYEPGAFTGAKKEGRKGLIENADKGTIFLDEIGELPKILQVKLLHFLQGKYITRVGSSKPIHVNARVIAATNKNLEEMIHIGTFREDLYYRLNVIPIKLPPLRNRKEDILSLIKHFLQLNQKQYGIEKTLAPDALDKLVKYSWPGNVRELQNIIERIVITSANETITVLDLPEYIQKVSSLLSTNENTLTEYVEEVEAEKIFTAYKKYMSTYKAAKALGMSQSTFSRKLRRYKEKNC